MVDHLKLFLMQNMELENMQNPEVTFCKLFHYSFLPKVLVKGHSDQLCDVEIYLQEEKVQNTYKTLWYTLIFI